MFIPEGRAGPEGLVIARISELKPHEELVCENLEKVRRDISAEQIVRTAIIVDRATGVILDGHHRVAALRELGLSRVPAVFVDILDESIVSVSWKDGQEFDKRKVVAAGLSGRPLPPKSSRNLVRREGKLVHVSTLGEGANVPIEKLR